MDATPLDLWKTCDQSPASSSADALRNSAGGFTRNERVATGDGIHPARNARARSVAVVDSGMPPA